jgi:hypothetical protein
VEDLTPESTHWVAKAESQQNARYLAKGIDKAEEEFHLRYVILCYCTGEAG